MEYWSLNPSYEDKSLDYKSLGLYLWYWLQIIGLWNRGKAKDHRLLGGSLWVRYVTTDPWVMVICIWVPITWSRYKCKALANRSLGRRQWGKVLDHISLGCILWGKALVYISLGRGLKGKTLHYRSLVRGFTMALVLEACRSAQFNKGNIKYHLAIIPDLYTSLQIEVTTYGHATSVTYPNITGNRFVPHSFGFLWHDVTFAFLHTPHIYVYHLPYCSKQKDRQLGR